MKEHATPIVAQAAIEVLAPIAKLAKRIAAHYDEALEFGNKEYAAGMKIGKSIIEACRDAEIIREVTRENSPAAKRAKGGGTDIRIHSYVAEQLAKAAGYNAEYLKQCAREYLGGLDKHLENSGQQPTEYKKGDMGKLANLPAILPDIKAEPPLCDGIKTPKIQNVFGKSENSGEPEPLRSEEDGQKLATLIIKKLSKSDIGNQAVVRGIVKTLSPILEANGFVVRPKARDDNSAGYIK